MERLRPFHLAIAPLVLATPAPAQEEEGVRRHELPGPPAQEQCAYGPQDSEAIVVCGRRAPRGTYRIIPREHDPDRPITQSWGAQVRQHLEAARYGDQTVGPFGYRQRSRQMDAQWREERRQIRARENYRGD